MSEREVNIFKNVDLSSPVRDHTETVNVIEQGEVSPEALDRIRRAEKGELKAKLAAILDRGVVQDRLKVDLPDDIHGEWVRNDPFEIGRLKTLGFEIDDKYASVRAIHSDGSSGALISDVIHMICPRVVKDIIDEIREEQIIKQHMKKKIGSKEINREEVDFISTVQREAGNSKVSAYSDSKETSVSAEDVSRALQNIDSQVKTYNNK